MYKYQLLYVYINDYQSGGDDDDHDDADDNDDDDDDDDDYAEAPDDVDAHDDGSS